MAYAYGKDGKTVVLQDGHQQCRNTAERRQEGAEGDLVLRRPEPRTLYCDPPLSRGRRKVRCSERIERFFPREGRLPTHPTRRMRGPVRRDARGRSETELHRAAGFAPPSRLTNGRSGKSPKTRPPIPCTGLAALKSMGSSVTTAVSPLCCGESRPGSLIAAALEEIRGRRPSAHRLRHGHHVEAGAVAGQVHHFEFGGRERAIKPFARAKITDVSTCGLQHRPDVDIDHDGVHGPALRRIGELLVLRPCVRDRARNATILFSTASLSSIALRGTPDSVASLRRQFHL